MPCQTVLKLILDILENASDKWTNIYGDFFLRGQVSVISSDLNLLTPAYSIYIHDSLIPFRLCPSATDSAEFAKSP